MQKCISMPVITHHGGLGERSTILRNIKAGLFPAPVKVGRSNVWPENEIELLQAARIRGDNDEQIRALVNDLMAKRKELPASVRAEIIASAAEAAQA
jgi:predicted DNA-binding transcriptional regulator AlpA